MKRGNGATVTETCGSAAELNGAEEIGGINVCKYKSI